jgi:hypothetical protein
MLHREVWYPEHPELGLGVIVVINPYHDGVPSYANNEHYKVYFPKRLVYINLFKKDLIITKEYHIFKEK